MGWLERLTRPSRDRFARRVARALAGYGASAPIEYQADSFSIRVGDGRQFFLDNAYKDYCAAAFRDRGQVLAGYFDVAAMAMEIPERYEDARADLLPKVRERFWGESLRLHSALQDKGPLAAPSRPLTDEYMVELVWDQPLIMATVSADTLERWGVGFEQALEVARENLWSRSRLSFQALAPGLYVSTWRDTHDASRVVLHELLWQLHLAGDPVAFLPNRDCLLVAGADDALSLIAAAAVAEKELQGTRPMSGIPLLLAGREWRVFEPPAGHGAAQAIRNLVLFSRAQQYAAQKALLERADERGGRDVFHADCTLMKREDGSRYSYCVWARGVVGTLPETDRIAFTDTGEDGAPRILGGADAGRVRDVMGERMRRLEHHPPRWAVDAFPSDEQLRELIEPGALV